MSQSTHALQPYWDLLLAGMQADVLEAALETGVLDALATPLTAPALADKLQLDVMRLEPVLDVLCGLGVLSYQLCEAECLTTQRHYRVTDVSAAHWRRDAEHMCIDAWRFRYKAMRGAGRRIAQALRGREPSVRENEDAEQGKQWAAAARDHRCRCDGHLGCRAASRHRGSLCRFGRRCGEYRHGVSRALASGTG